MTQQSAIAVSQPDADEKARFDAATPETYARIIWESISAYNYKAQLEIAHHLHASWVKEKDELFKKNLLLRIFQMYIESIDHFGLICNALLSQTGRPFYEKYVKADNNQIKSFWKRADAGLPRSELELLLGFCGIELTNIRNQSDQEKSRKKIEEEIDAFDQILKTVANIYLDESSKGKPRNYSGSVRGSFAIKHGFKLVSPTAAANTVWDLQGTDAAVMQDLVELELNSTKKTLVKIGALSQNNNTPGYLQTLLNNMEITSKYINWIANIQLGILDDNFYSVGFLAHHSVLKIGRNDKCLCGSGKDFKRCHNLVEVKLQ